MCLIYVYSITENSQCISCLKWLHVHLDGKKYRVKFHKGNSMTTSYFLPFIISYMWMIYLNQYPVVYLGLLLILSWYILSVYFRAVREWNSPQKFSDPLINFSYLKYKIQTVPQYWYTKISTNCFLQWHVECLIKFNFLK